MGVLLNCRKATKLLLEAEDRPLTRGEYARLEFHIAYCLSCRNFRRQMKFLKVALEQYAKSGPDR